jgi:hypothetical protein
MEHPLLTLLGDLRWTIAVPPPGLAHRVADAWVAHTKDHTPEVLGESGFVVLPKTNILHHWVDALEEAAIAATLTCARWTLLSDGQTLVAVDAWQRLAPPTQRVAWMDRLDSVRARTWLDAHNAGRGFPAAPNRSGSWSHWMAPLGQTGHDGDPHNPKGATAWLDATDDGRFVLRAGSHVAHRLAPSLLQRPDSVARTLAARAQVGLRATVVDAELLTTLEDSAPMDETHLAQIVTGIDETSKVLHPR